MKNILLQIAIVLVIAFIIIINTTTIIDKKMSNIAVNIPPFPKANIEIKIQKQCNSDEYQVYATNKNSNYVKPNTITLNPSSTFDNKAESVEHFDNSGSNIDMSEKLQLQSRKPQLEGDNIDLHGMVKPEEVQAGFSCDKFAGKMNETKSPNDAIIKYDNYTCYRNDSEEGMHKAVKNPYVSKNGNASLRNNYNMSLSHFKIAPEPEIVCNEGETFFSNNINDLEGDIADRYKKNLHIIKSSMEDPLTRGGNILDFDKYAKPADIGRITLTDVNTLPKSSGHLFENSSGYIR
jgi:hypothetical protein